MDKGISFVLLRNRGSLPSLSKELESQNNQSKRESVIHEPGERSGLDHLHEEAEANIADGSGDRGSGESRADHQGRLGIGCLEGLQEIRTGDDWKRNQERIGCRGGAIHSEHEGCRDGHAGAGNSGSHGETLKDADQDRVHQAHPGKLSSLLASDLASEFSGEPKDQAGDEKSHSDHDKTVEKIVVERLDEESDDARWDHGENDKEPGTPGLIPKLLFLAEPVDDDFQELFSEVDDGGEKSAAVKNDLRRSTGWIEVQEMLGENQVSGT